MTDHKTMRNVMSHNGGGTVDRGFFLPACSGSCDQGRKECKTRDACQLPEDDEQPHLFASGWFWMLGFLCLGLWGAVLAFLAVNGWL